MIDSENFPWYFIRPDYNSNALVLCDMLTTVVLQEQFEPFLIITLVDEQKNIYTIKSIGLFTLACLLMV